MPAPGAKLTTPAQLKAFIDRQEVRQVPAEIHADYFILGSAE